MIESKIPQKERLIRLNDIARKQMILIQNNKSLNELQYLQNNKIIHFYNKKNKWQIKIKK